MSLINPRRKRPRIALFFSGVGSTLQALIDQSESLNIVCAISSKKSALGRLRSRRHGVADFAFQFPDDFTKVLELLKSKSIDTIMLVGFLKIIPADFVATFNKLGSHQRMMNIHPSFLPDYKGLRSVEKAFEEKNRLGVTIHHVVAEVDSGKFFKQQEILNRAEISKVSLKEAQLWGRACEQQLIKSWGTFVA